MTEDVNITNAGELYQHNDSVTSLELHFPVEFVKEWMKLSEQRWKGNIVSCFQNKSLCNAFHTFPESSAALKAPMCQKEQSSLLHPSDSSDVLNSVTKLNQEKSQESEECCRKTDSCGIVENETVSSHSAMTNSSELLPHTSKLIAASIETGFRVIQNGDGTDGKSSVYLLLRITSVGLKVRSGNLCVVLVDVQKLSNENSTAVSVFAPHESSTIATEHPFTHTACNTIRPKGMGDQGDQEKEQGNVIQELLMEPTMPCENQHRNTVDNFVSGMQKRKRGRPRKIVVEQSLNKARSSSSTALSVEKEKDVVPAETIQVQNGEGKNRYSLRGKKLPAYIFGSGETDEEDEDYILKRGRQVLLSNATAAEKAGDLEHGRDLVTIQDDDDHDYTTSALKRRVYKMADPDSATKASRPQTSGRKRMKVDMNGLPRFARRARNNQKLVACKYCHRKFCDYSGVAMHAKRFHQQEPDLSSYLHEVKKLEVLHCAVCGLQCENRFRLQQHEDEKHFKLAKVQCRHCGKPFNNLLRLRAHIRAVHQVQGKAHACPHCTATFKWAATLKSHVEEIHAGIKAVACGVCQKKFYRQSQLNRHIKIHGVEEDKLACDLCPRKFWYATNLKRHVKIVHEPRVQRCHCSYCGKGFSRKESLTGHVEKVHFALFSFRCQQCNAGFARSFALEKHMATVHDLPGFKAPQGRPPRFKYNRTDEDVQCCSACGEKFFYKAQLVQHVHSTHIAAFPYHCDTCQQGFLEEQFLQVHRLKAHGVATKQQEDEVEGAANVESLSPSNALMSAADLPGVNPNHLRTNTQEVPMQLQMQSDGPYAEGFHLGASLASLGVGSYVIEVEEGEHTVKYVIEHSEDTGSPDVEDIASLLLVTAGQTLRPVSISQEIVLEPGKSPTTLLPTNDALRQSAIIGRDLATEGVTWTDEPGVEGGNRSMESRLEAEVTLAARDGDQVSTPLAKAEKERIIVVDDMDIAKTHI